MSARDAACLPLLFSLKLDYVSRHVFGENKIGMIQWSRIWRTLTMPMKITNKITQMHATEVLNTVGAGFKHDWVQVETQSDTGSVPSEHWSHFAAHHDHSRS